MTYCSGVCCYTTSTSRTDILPASPPRHTLSQTRTHGTPGSPSACHSLPILAEAVQSAKPAFTLCFCTSCASSRLNITSALPDITG